MSKGNTMAIQIGAKPDSGFDDPIGMLKDCHRRIESFLGILCVVVDRAQGRSLADEERDAVKAALSTSEPADNATRRMRKNRSFRDCESPTRNPSRRLTGLRTIITRQTNLHGSIERLYSVWIESGWLGMEETQLLLSQTARLKQLYSDHIQVEETIVFARASQVLDSHAIEAIGTEFRFPTEITHCSIEPCQLFPRTLQSFLHSTPRSLGSLHARMAGLSRVGNQIHVHLVGQISLPMPSSLRCHDQPQEDTSESCCSGNG